MPRIGYLTPSSFPDLMKDGRGNEVGKAALAVVDQFALDLLQVERDEPATSASTEWGNENEFLAIEEYERRTLLTVRKMEFKTANEYVGGTGDGLVGSKGGIEVKCPKNPVIHLRREFQRKNYYWQMVGYMWIYELDWIDFVSFDPRYPADMQLIVDRIERKESDIDLLKARCEWAYKEAKKIIESVKSINFIEA